MVVTLDVSKLSGWLNTAAPCRVESEPCGKRGGMRGRATVGACGTATAQAACAGRNPNAEVAVAAGAGAEHTRNICFMVVTLDVSKLSG